MSIISSNSQEISIKNNKAAQILREIFDIIEAKNENQNLENKNSSLIEKYNIKNIKIVKINGFDIRPKNKYKLKLQNILFKKNKEKKIQ